MRHARIYKPAKTAMQSGKAGSKEWCLEYKPIDSRYIEPVMGWTASKDMLQNEVKLYFISKEDAISYAEREKIAYEVVEPKVSTLKIQSYTNNFKYIEHV